MNHVELTGNLTRDPVLRYTKTGRPVAAFGIALNRKYIDASGQEKQLADFINVTVWDKLAEAVASNLHKGDWTHVQGRLSSRSYEDKDGKKVYVVEVVASLISRPLPTYSAAQTGVTGYGQAQGGASQPRGNFQRFGAQTPSYDQEDIPF